MSISLIYVILCIVMNSFLKKSKTLKPKLASFIEGSSDYLVGVFPQRQKNIKLFATPKIIKKNCLNVSLNVFGTMSIVGLIILE